MDSGANGGKAGSSMLVLATSPIQKVDIHGLENAKMEDIPVCTTACKLMCKKNGTVIGIWNQYACTEGNDGYGTGQTIHAPA